MTIKSWKEEFYPIPASKVVGSDDVALVKHSLQKWIGLRDENLHKHNLHKVMHESNPILSSADNRYEFRISGENCALCLAHAIEVEDEYTVHACETCPIYKSRGGFACDECDEHASNEELSSVNPWSEFVDYNDPEPMIEALEVALSYVNQQESLSK